jgi:hypothetical protein
MDFYKTQTGTYLVLDKVNFFQCTFGKRAEDGTFIFSQETFPPELLAEVEQIYENAPITPVDWADSPVSKQDVEAALLQNLGIGNMID